MTASRDINYILPTLLPAAPQFLFPPQAYAQLPVAVMLGLTTAESALHDMLSAEVTDRCMLCRSFKLVRPNEPKRTYHRDLMTLSSPTQCANTVWSYVTPPLCSSPLPCWAPRFPDPWLPSGYCPFSFLHKNAHHASRATCRAHLGTLWQQWAHDLPTPLIPRPPPHTGFSAAQSTAMGRLNALVSDVLLGGGGWPGLLFDWGLVDRLLTKFNWHYYSTCVVRQGLQVGGGWAGLG